MLQVVDDGLADHGRERERRRVAGLALRDRQALTLPVDVVEGERGDLPAAQAIGDQQQQDRVVPPARRGPAVDTGQDPVDLVPGDRPRDARQPVDLRPAHGAAQIAGEDTVPVRRSAGTPAAPRPVAHRALGQPGASAFDDEGAQDRRRELLDRGDTDPPQVGLEALEVVPIAAAPRPAEGHAPRPGSRRSQGRRRRTGGRGAAGRWARSQAARPRASARPGPGPPSPSACSSRYARRGPRRARPRTPRRAPATHRRPAPLAHERTRRTRTRSGTRRQTLFVL